jgi:hypothetical protein
LRPVTGDPRLQQQRRSQIDRLYQRVVDDLGKLMQAVGLKNGCLSPQRNQNKILVALLVTD